MIKDTFSEVFSREFQFQEIYKQINFSDNTCSHSLNRQPDTPKPQPETP